MSLYGVAKALVTVFNKLAFRVRVLGDNKLPDGPVVICPNHLSYMDPLFVGASIDRRTTFIAKESLFHKPFLGWFLRKLQIIPVNRGGGDLAAIKTAVRALQDSNVLVIFPQGTRCMGNPPAAQDAKGGAAMIALKGKAKIVPVSITTKGYKVRLFRKVFVNFGKAFEMDELFDGTNDKDFTFLSRKIFSRVVELDEETRRGGAKV